MKEVNNKLRVVHFPQVGSCKHSFKVEVKNEAEAFLMLNALASQHLWLEKHHIIPDYSNALFVEMYDESINDETEERWTDYYNEEEGLDWDEFVTKYFQ